MLSFKVDIYFQIILFIGMFLKGISFFGKVVFGINEEIISVVYFILKYKFGIQKIFFLGFDIMIIML